MEDGLPAHPPILSTGNTVVVKQVILVARLDMSFAAVLLSLGASIVLLILVLVFSIGHRSSNPYLTSMGFLQTIWVFEHHPELLREAGMVTVRDSNLLGFRTSPRQQLSLFAWKGKRKWGEQTHHCISVCVDCTVLGHRPVALPVLASLSSPWPSSQPWSWQAQCASSRFLPSSPWLREAQRASASLSASPPLPLRPPPPRLLRLGINNPQEMRRVGGVEQDEEGEREEPHHPPRANLQFLFFAFAVLRDGEVLIPRRAGDPKRVKHQSDVRRDSNLDGKRRNSRRSPAFFPIRGVVGGGGDREAQQFSTTE
ncbi:hypothetical protein K438DRAFT_1990028 [Mycena galopus ATCC 62051]|nr:hypothetical protein K438DRAFT_1990028 [Mycena galopus ATCC 62051]